MSAAEKLRNAGIDGARSQQILGNVQENPKTYDEIIKLKNNSGMGEGDTFERALLGIAADHVRGKICELPIYPPVMDALRSEFASWNRAKARDPILAGTYRFVIAAKMATLRRFPAGPMDWEISGMPRSWLLKVPKRDLARVARMIAFELGGFRPVFFMHVAPKPRQRALVIEREALKGYYQMARSLELQPEARGIMAHAWFHDQNAVKENPHLEGLNRPYREAGGLLTTIGKAGADSGMLERNAERARRLESGELNYKMGLAIWPRARAIEWAKQHPEFESGGERAARS
jgi:hypothetical protein